jgi:TonB family protein
VGAYPLVEFLGSGLDSLVFLTVHDSQNAAIKLLSLDPQEIGPQIARWKTASKLSHPNLIRILNSGSCELDGIPLAYVVMELADENLAQVIPERALTADEARSMLEPTVKAMEYIHRQGFVHGHLKASNIMAIGDQVKISSDGIRQPQGAMMPASDVRGLGVTLVEVLTQHPPARGFVPKDLPKPFADIARHCLEPLATNRWTLTQVSECLNPPAGTIAPHSAAAARRKRFPGGASVLLALVVIVVVGVMIRRAETGTPASKPPAEVKQTPEPAATPAAPSPVAAKTPAPAAPVQEKPAAEKAATERAAPEKAAPQEPPAEASSAEPASTTAPVAGLGDEPMPQIPNQARNTIHGRVRLSVTADVDSSGAVTNVKLNPPAASRYFGDRTLKAVRQWKFPASGGDQKWRVQFEFQRSGTKVQPRKLTP